MLDLLLWNFIFSIEQNKLPSSNIFNASIPKKLVNETLDSYEHVTNSFWQNF